MSSPHDIDIEDYKEELRSDELSTLVDQIGHFFDRFGFKRNLGRIWASVYLAPGPLTQSDIGELLGLSTGLVSSSLKELTHWGAIRVVSTPGVRSTQYEAEEKLLRIVASILAKRELEAVRRLRDAARDVRLSYSPLGYAERFEKRLEAIERTADLYEALTGLIQRVARLPMSAIDHTMRVVKAGRFLEALGRKGLRNNNNRDRRDRADGSYIHSESAR